MWSELTPEERLEVRSVLDPLNPCHVADTCTNSPVCAMYYEYCQYRCDDDS